MYKASGTATTSYPSRFYTFASTTLSATTTKSIYAPDGTLLATVQGSGTSTATTTYDHADHLGGTNAVTNPNQSISQTLDYYPYGSERISSGTSATDRHYIGERFDEDSGLNYLNARYYRNTSGQFLSQDPVFLNLGVDRRTFNFLLDPQKLNSYSYARGNPLTLRDSTGEAAAFLAIPASSAIVDALVSGFFTLGAIKNAENVYNNIVLPLQYPAAYTPEQTAETPYRFFVTLAKDNATVGIANDRASVLADTFFNFAEFLPEDAVNRDKKKNRNENDSTFKFINEVTGHGGSSSGGASTPTYASHGSGGGGGYGFTTRQEDALRRLIDAINSADTTSGALNDAFRNVIKEFSPPKTSNNTPKSGNK